MTLTLYTKDGLRKSPAAGVYDTDAIGTIKAFAGPVFPPGWLLCDGRTLLRADYPDLFNALGGASSVWGLPDASSFQIPDLRSRMIVGAGQGAGLTNRAVAAKGGEESHLLTTAEAAQKAVATGTDSVNHSHVSPYTGGGHGFINEGTGAAQMVLAAGSSLSIRYDDQYTGGVNTWHTHSIAGSSAAAAHENMPPWCAVAQIIKATGMQVNPAGTLIGAANLPIVTALPLGPTDGQECYFLADAANGVLWRLRYRAASASASQWEFVGGPALAKEAVGAKDWNGTWETTTSLNYTTLTTAGPSLVVPLAGEYDVEGTAIVGGSVGGQLAGFLLSATGDATTPWNGGDGINLVANVNYAVSVWARRTRTLAAGNTVQMLYATSNASQAARFQNRSLWISPRRVG